MSQACAAWRPGLAGGVEGRRKELARRGPAALGALGPFLRAAGAQRITRPACRSGAARRGRSRRQELEQRGAAPRCTLVPGRGVRAALAPRTAGAGSGAVAERGRGRKRARPQGSRWSHQCRNLDGPLPSPSSSGAGFLDWRRDPPQRQQEQQRLSVNKLLCGGASGLQGGVCLCVCVCVRALD